MASDKDDTIKAETVVDHPPLEPPQCKSMISYFVGKYFGNISHLFWSFVSTLPPRTEWKKIANKQLSPRFVSLCPDALVCEMTKKSVRLLNEFCLCFGLWLLESLAGPLSVCSHNCNV